MPENLPKMFSGISEKSPFYTQELADYA